MNISGKDYLERILMLIAFLQKKSILYCDVYNLPNVIEDKEVFENLNFYKCNKLFV